MEAIRVHLFFPFPSEVVIQFGVAGLLYLIAHLLLFVVLGSANLCGAGQRGS